MSSLAELNLGERLLFLEGLAKIQKEYGIASMKVVDVEFTTQAVNAYYPYTVTTGTTGLVTTEDSDKIETDFTEEVLRQKLG